MDNRGIYGVFILKLITLLTYLPINIILLFLLLSTTMFIYIHSAPTLLHHFHTYINNHIRKYFRVYFLRNDCNQYISNLGIKNTVTSPINKYNWIIRVCTVFLFYENYRCQF